MTWWRTWTRRWRRLPAAEVLGHRPGARGGASHGSPRSQSRRGGAPRARGVARGGHLTPRGCSQRPPPPRAAPDFEGTHDTAAAHRPGALGGASHGSPCSQSRRGGAPLATTAPGPGPAAPRHRVALSDGR